MAINNSTAPMTHGAHSLMRVEASSASVTDPLVARAREAPADSSATKVRTATGPGVTVPSAATYSRR